MMSTARSQKHQTRARFVCLEMRRVCRLPACAVAPSIDHKKRPCGKGLCARTVLECAFGVVLCWGYRQCLRILTGSFRPTGYLGFDEWSVNCDFSRHRRESNCPSINSKNLDTTMKIVGY